MISVIETVESLGGVARKQQLVSRGVGDRDLPCAVREGQVFRARQGCYAALPENSEHVRAIRVGGCLTGISAIRAAGGWVLGESPLHVSVPPNASKLRSQFNRFAKLAITRTRGVVLHWDGSDIDARGTVTSVDITDAIQRVIRDEP
ncbi:MAG: hypothetical protein ACOH1J_05315 [Microbacteriaceae bacterium]